MSGHKRDCKKLQNAIKPLMELMKWQRCEGTVKYIDYTSWLSMDMMAVYLADKNSNIWQQGVQEWTKQNYLDAMVLFQNYLSPYKKAWNSNPGKQTFDTKDLVDSENEKLFCMRAINLAKKLLFCAYCELDGAQIDSARQRLVQCISLLITIQSLQSCDKEGVQTTMDDAWMELTLSMEEVPSDRIVARHTAKMAIATESCWTDPLQRPGYVAKVQLVGEPFIPRDRHPSWCKVIEANWKFILEEYESLVKHRSSWHDVGSGHRGSGHDDHRVVSGKKWTEYVLFGSGSSENDNDAPITKQLIRKYVPDAVSLAQMGGGEVIFSRLEGGTQINAHCGTTNVRWTAHLALVVPMPKSDCRIRIADDWYNWEVGKLLIFDDSFEHEVVNNTCDERVVLLIRLWHPELKGYLRNETLAEAIAKKEESVAKRYHPPS